MIQIGKAILSFDVFDKYFLCDILKCKGVCCVEGDSGAPLTKKEARLIKKHYPKFEKYVSEKYKAVIEKNGFSKLDADGDLVTPLYNNRECVYTFQDENGITKCAIERAFLDGDIDFRKPVSCHLFPIRVTVYDEFDAVNYQKLDICKEGRACGTGKKLPLYKFLKEPLERLYGEAWYKELEVAANYLETRDDL